MPDTLTIQARFSYEGEGQDRGERIHFWKHMLPKAYAFKVFEESKRTQNFHPTVERMAVSHHEKVEVFNVFPFGKKHHFGLVWIQFDPSVLHLRANFL